MNKIIYKFIIVILVLGFSSCIKEGQSTSVSDTNHIKYFGFTLIDTFWDDPSDTVVKTDYSDEVHEFSNMADILVVNPSDNIVERMNAKANLQMKSILHLNEIFFELVGTGGQSEVIYKLRNDYQSRWNEFVSVNQLQSNQELIQAFYIGEEPTWNSISFSDLKSATDYVKSTFPDIPILIIEASSAINELQIPTSVDWIGFDHYFINNPNTDPTYRNELNLLKSKFTNNQQKLVLIMDTHFIDFAHGDFGGIALNEMKDVANNYYQLAKEETLTIAILGYFWPSGFDVPASIGARNMPQIVKDEYSRIGKEITGKD